MDPGSAEIGGLDSYSRIGCAGLLLDTNIMKEQGIVSPSIFNITYNIYNIVYIIWNF